MLSRTKPRPKIRPQLIGALVTALGLSFASSAWAAPADADRAAARQLGYQGVEAYQAGDYATAQDKLQRAFDVVKVPTLGLWLARTLTKNGRWVEAAEVYREVSRLEVTEGKLEAQQEAQRAAASELDELVAKIPAIVIMIEGAQANQVVVEIDGVQVPAAVLGEARPMDPGRHRVVGKSGSQVYEQVVELGPSEQRKLRLAFKPESTKSAVKATDAAAAEPKDDAGTSTGGDTQRTLGWAALGVGAAGIVTGGVTGFLVLGKKRALEDNANCSGTTCAPPAHDDVDSYNRLRTISTVSFIVGGAAAALGTTLLLTSHGSEGDAGTSVSAYVGVGHAGVTGSF